MVLLTSNFNWRNSISIKNIYATIFLSHKRENFLWDIRPKPSFFGDVFVVLYILKLKLRTNFSYKLITWLCFHLMLTAKNHRHVVDFFLAKFL